MTIFFEFKLTSYNNSNKLINVKSKVEQLKFVKILSIIRMSYLIHKTHDKISRHQTKSLK